MAEAGVTAGRIGDRLVAAGLASPQAVDAAARQQRTVRGSLGYHLLQMGAVEPAQLAAFFEREIEQGRVGALDRPRDPAILEAVPARLAHLYNVYPLGVERGRVQIGVPPTLTAAGLARFAEAAGLVVEPSVLPARVIRRAIERDYLGGAQATVVQPTAGLTTLVVDDGAGVKPLAPELRTPDLSAEVLLRSMLAEAVAQRRRTIDLSLRPSAAFLRSGASVAALACRLAGIPPATTGDGERAVGRFQLNLRGRRPGATVVRGVDGGVRVYLAEARFATDDVDELFEGFSDVQDGIEALASRRRGLVLACGPAGGGARRLVDLLGARLSEALGDGHRVGDAPAPSGKWANVKTASTDAEIARGLHESMTASAPVVVVDELPGPLSVERALLVAAQRPVLAGFVATDAAAALAWLNRQGLAGALKAGLLRGILSVLALDEACLLCAAPTSLPAGLTRDWAIDASDVTPVANAGCDRCLDVPVRRTVACLEWTPVGLPPTGRSEHLLSDDEIVSRRELRERGSRTILDLALVAACGGGAEIGAAIQLLGVGR